ncbi:YlxR family protein [Actinomyces oricola]|uniref:YlxR family protein n=1 Tax=Actinomyces oricola TaxID=206043 RepID=UPI000FFF33A3|nr:YlxR family protein [Actinomyces oricola]
MARTTHQPERTCIGCRGKAPRAQLLRLTMTTSGELAVDARATAPGRGAWIHPDPACLDLAERRRAFRRALRTSGSPDATPVRSWLTSRRPGEYAGPTGAGTTDSKGG